MLTAHGEVAIRSNLSRSHHHHRVGPYEAPGGILTVRVDNHPPPMPVRSPWPRMARQRWAASSMIHPRARMTSVRKTPSPEDTISKTGGTSPTVHPSPRGQHTDSTMLPPLMPEPPSPSSSCGGHTKPPAAS